MAPLVSNADAPAGATPPRVLCKPEEAVVVLREVLRAYV
jgi:hypothetical protein